MVLIHFFVPWNTRVTQNMAPCCQAVVKGGMMRGKGEVRVGKMREEKMWREEYEEVSVWGFGVLEDRVVWNFRVSRSNLLDLVLSHLWCPRHREVWYWMLVLLLHCNYMWVLRQHLFGYFTCFCGISLCNRIDIWSLLWNKKVELLLQVPCIVSRLVLHLDFISARFQL